MLALIVIFVSDADAYADCDADAQCALVVNNGWPACTTASLRLRYIQYKFTCQHHHRHQHDHDQNDHHHHDPHYNDQLYPRNQTILKNP